MIGYGSRTERPRLRRVTTVSSKIRKGVHTMARPTDEKKGVVIKVRISEDMYNDLISSGDNLSKTIRDRLRSNGRSVYTQMDISQYIDTDHDKVNDSYVRRGEYDDLRYKIAKQLGNKCARCGSTEGIQYHHIRPLQYGGTNDIENLVPLCKLCHKEVHGYSQNMDAEIKRLRKENENLRQKISVLKKAIVALGD